MCKNPFFKGCVFLFSGMKKQTNGGNNSITNISDCHMLLFYFVIAMSVI